MRPIEFKSSTAQRVYNDYLTRCRRQVNILSEADQEDCLMEVNSYIYEYLQNHQNEDETTALLNILERLGSPDVTLKEVVAAKKIDQAVKTFNLKHLIQALALNVRNGAFYVVLSIMTVLLVSFPVLIILKIMYPDKTGLFVGPGHFFFGIMEKKEGVSEVLGGGFIPVVVVLGFLLYFIIIFLLKLVTNKKP
jgi:uncharacterized membrane protein